MTDPIQILRICQWNEDSTDEHCCDKKATRKWGDYWFCEWHGRRIPSTESSSYCDGGAKPADVLRVALVAMLADLLRDAEGRRDSRSQNAIIGSLDDYRAWVLDKSDVKALLRVIELVIGEGER